MKKIQSENKESEIKVLVACYRKPYSVNSLEKIKKLLKKERPKEVLVLSISERNRLPGTIENYFGTKDIKTFMDRIDEDKTIRSARYANEIKQICNKFKINCMVKQKKGKGAKLIKKISKTFKPNIIIIHRSDKSSVDKYLSGSVSDEVCQDNSCIITIY